MERLSAPHAEISRDHMANDAECIFHGAVFVFRGGNANSDITGRRKLTAVKPAESDGRGLPGPGEFHASDDIFAIAADGHG